MCLDILNRIQGGLFGLAIGDALGATLEFLNREEIYEKYGTLKNIIGGGWLNLEPGACTDDTAMTLAVARGIIDNPNNPYFEIGHHFVAWYNTNPKDIGNIVQISIKNFKKCNSWPEASQKAHVILGSRSAGNGSLMRTLPISFAYRDNRTKLCRISAQVSYMTHYDTQATAACIFYNLLVWQILIEEETDKAKLISSALTQAIDFCSSHLPPLPKDYWNDIKEFKYRSQKQVWASGYVLDSLIASLWSFFHADSLEEAIIQSVNLGDDADTVGAICGGLAGTYYGFQEIPDRWLKVLKDKESLYYISKELSNM